MRQVARFVWQVLNDFMGHDCPKLAAALAFYTFFTLPAVLLLLLVAVGTLTDPLEVQRSLTAQVESLIGPAGALQVEEIFGHLMTENERPPGLTVIGGLMLAFGATTGFAALQDSLNRIWSVERDPARGRLRNYLAKRVFSFGVVLALGFLILVSLVLSAFLAHLGDRIALARPGWSEPLLWGVDTVLSLGVITALFATMFKMIPDVRVAWRDVWFGALVTAVLFVLGKALIGMYLGGKDPGGTYGAAGSLAVLLIWVYYTSMIVLLGAEITRAWEERYGRGIDPGPGAVEVVHTVSRGREGEEA